MSEGKRYYWLKLKEDFFKSKRIKKLRNMAGGDTYTIIYLKMQLLSLRTEGVLQWAGLEDNFANELALDLDEKPEDVEVTLMYLLKTGLAETLDNVSFFLPWVLENTGSETAAAQRMRDMRDRIKLEERNNVTPMLQDCYVEIDKEKDIDKESEKEKRKRFVPPTQEEVQAYCDEKGYNIDVQFFFRYYTASNWKRRDGTPVKNWKQTVVTWAKKDSEKQPQRRNQITAAKEYKPPNSTIDTSLLDAIKGAGL